MQDRLSTLLSPILETSERTRRISKPSSPPSKAAYSARHYRSCQLARGKKPEYLACGTWHSGSHRVDTAEFSGTSGIKDLPTVSSLIRAGTIDLSTAVKHAQAWPTLEGLDLAKEVTCADSYLWTESAWAIGEGYSTLTEPRHHVVAMDFGAKRNILRSLAALGCKVTVAPASTSADDILGLNPDGIFIKRTGRSNGHGRLRRAHHQGLGGEW